MKAKDVWRALRALVSRPSLAVESTRMLASMRRRGRPTPSSDYLRWRMTTAYGRADAGLSGEDLVHYLEWRRQMRRIRAWEPM